MGGASGIVFFIFSLFLFFSFSDWAMIMGDVPFQHFDCSTRHWRARDESMYYVLRIHSLPTIVYPLPLVFPSLGLQLNKRVFHRLFSFLLLFWSPSFPPSPVLPHCTVWRTKGALHSPPLAPSRAFHDWPLPIYRRIHRVNNNGRNTLLPRILKSVCTCSPLLPLVLLPLLLIFFFLLERISFRYSAIVHQTIFGWAEIMYFRGKYIESPLWYLLFGKSSPATAFISRFFLFLPYFILPFLRERKEAEKELLQQIYILKSTLQIPPNVRILCKHSQGRNY